MKRFEMVHKESQEHLGTLSLADSVTVGRDEGMDAWILRDSENLWFGIFSNVDLAEIGEAKAASV